MDCTRCGSANRAEASFCRNCGQRLERKCPRCGTAADASARFCDNCGTELSGATGLRESDSSITPNPVTPNPLSYTPQHLAERILNSRSALEGERKHVTVLFADVQSSMQLAEQVDPEEWHDIIERFLLLLAEGVHRFEGTVNQFTGDGIMALFGAPIAHEDHAHRACHAALHLRDTLRKYGTELRREHGIGFSARIGINSGEVVVGRIGDDLRMDYTAMGHTVGLAARMEQLAQPQGICLSEHTARLVEGYFALRNLGPARVKGVSEPVRIYELEGLGPHRTRFDASRMRGFTPFVGRESEMAALEEALAEAMSTGGRVIGIVAEAGVGKSRLCHEFAERCRARVIDVSAAQAVSHGRMIPFLPVLGLLRSFFRIGEHDRPVEVQQKVAGALLLLDPALQETLPLWLDFLGVPDPSHPLPPHDAETRQRLIFEGLRRLNEARSRVGPGVLVIEDVHWADPASDAALAYLIDAMPASRSLLVINFRPEYRAGWMSRPHYRELRLKPLADDETERLLDALLGRDSSLAAMRALVRERTAGNPFFVEELVRSLLERGVLVHPYSSDRLEFAPGDGAADLEIPLTVQAVLAARIDRLSDSDKHVLQTAAVIGKVFSEATLQNVIASVATPPMMADEVAVALRSLTEAALLVEEPRDSEPEYSFRHPLTQEVAYGSQLNRRREQLHGAVARYLATAHSDRLNERAALIAHHWEHAAEPLEAARWHRRAAEWVRTTNIPQSVAHWRRVQALVDPLPNEPERSALALTARTEILTLGPRIGLAEGERERLWDEITRMAGDVSDSRLGSQTILLYRPMFQIMAGEGEATIPDLRGALAGALTAGDERLTLTLQATLGLAYLYSGLLREGLGLVEVALAKPPANPRLGCELLATSPYILLHLFHAIFLRETGRPHEALRTLARGTAIAEQHQELEALTLLHLSHVDVARFLGEPDLAWRHAREAMAAAERVDSQLARNQAYAGLGSAHMQRGEWDAAILAFEQALAILHETRFGLADEGFRLTSLADAHLMRGEIDRAVELFAEALSSAQRCRNRLAELYCELGCARGAIAANGAGSAPTVEAHHERVLALSEQIGDRAIRPVLQIERASLAFAQQDYERWRTEMEEAERLFREMGATGNAQRIGVLIH